MTKPNGNEQAFTIEDLSARAYAAIHLCVPESGEEWLDEMITKALRDRVAEKALTGLILNTTDFDFNDGKEAAAILSYRLADAALKEREK